MNTQIEALRQSIDFLSGELDFLPTSIATARAEDNIGRYTKLLSSALPIQRQHLKLCAELEKLTEAEVDELAAFNGEVT